MKTKQTRASPGDKIRAVQLLVNHGTVSGYESVMLERVAYQLCREICKAGVSVTRLAQRLGMPEDNLTLMMDGKL